ncbi:hypothetical protein cypCar_00029531, partial [Cyprinus carpio]
LFVPVPLFNKLRTTRAPRARSSAGTRTASRGVSCVTMTTTAETVLTSLWNANIVYAKRRSSAVQMGGVY